MLYSRISTLFIVSCLVLSCFSCREPLGEQQGTTPSENGDPSPKKEDTKKAVPEKEFRKWDKSIPPKTKNGQKPKTRDTLSPKIALS